MNENGYGMPLSRLSCLAMAEENEKAWFVRSMANGLFELDKTENRARLLAKFEDFPIDRGFLYLGIEKVGDVLVLAPFCPPKVAFYDLAAGRMEYLELAPAEERKVKYAGGKCYFIKTYRHGDSVYLFGYEYPAILKVNVKTKQFIYYTDWVETVEQRIKKISNVMGYVSDYAVAGNYVWALCECANAVIRLDLQTDEIKVIDFCSDLDVHIGICFDGNFWITGYNETACKLLKYNSSFVLEDEIEIASVQKDGDAYSFSSQNNFWVYYPILNLGERLLLFSIYPKHVYEFDKNLNEVRICSVFEELLKIHDVKLFDVGIMVPRKKGNRICFITGNDFLWNEYDFVQNTLIRYEVEAESDEEFLRAKIGSRARKVLMENSMPWGLGYRLTLSQFLKHVDCLSKEGTGTDDSVGIKIYQKINEVSAI